MHSSLGFFRMKGLGITGGSSAFSLLQRQGSVVIAQQDCALPCRLQREGHVRLGPDLVHA